MALSKGFSAAARTISIPQRQESSLPVLLVVDDEPQITASLVDQFRRTCQVLTAANAKEALDVLKKQTVSVIVADQRMPGMTGAELLAEACRLEPEAVRILLTGYADIQAVIQAVNEGKIFFYLTKPWQSHELDAVIASAVEHNLLLKEKRILIRELRRINAELEDRVKKRTTELEQRARELEAANRKISDLAYIDPLTGIANRRRLDETLIREASRGNRLGIAITGILADVDHFKSVNDTFGHAMGDKVLQAIARSLLALARPYDLVARHGGEEFFVLLPDVTPEKGLEIAERFRYGIETMTIEGFSRQVTASFGVAGLSPGQSPDTLLDHADRALYRAKENGRNRVEIYTDR